MSVIANARQYLFPKEFRIPAMSWPVNVEDRLSKLEQMMRTAPQAGLSETKLRFLADVATQVWRLKQKTVRPGTEQPLEEMRRLFRYVQAMEDALHQAGVTIVDLTGRPYDSGLSVRVIAFEPTPGINREQIRETIKPAVYFGDQIIQMAEVIVEKPQDPVTP